MNSALVELIEGAARVRGDIPVPREFIVLALRLIVDREEDVLAYPGGTPSLKGVFDIAARLYAEQAPQQ